MPGAAVGRRKRPNLAQHPTPPPSPSPPPSPPPPPLPLDLVLEIAGRTDPETLVRCAATCKDLRRRIGDPGFRHRLRHGNRFVRDLLRGRLVGVKEKGEDVDDKYSSANAGWWSSSPTPTGPEDGKPFTLHGRPVAARDGLLLALVTEQSHAEPHLRVYSSATGRYQTIPPGPKFHGDYILLVGEGDGGGAAVGRSFKVLTAQLMAEVIDHNRWHHRYMWIWTFSSEHGKWGPRTSTAIPSSILRHPITRMRLIGKPLVFRDAVHWLCSTCKAHYVLTLHVDAASLTSTELPSSFPNCQPDQLLLATSSAGRSPIVLVAEVNKVRAWSRSECTGKWRKRPQLVIRNSAIETSRRRMLGDAVGQLKWFGERSGVVLILLPDRGDFCWLDLRTKEVIRCSGTVCYYPYEMDLSDWAPTFHKII